MQYQQTQEPFDQLDSIESNMVYIYVSINYHDAVFHRYLQNFHYNTPDFCFWGITDHKFNDEPHCNAPCRSRVLRNDYSSSYRHQKNGGGGGGGGGVLTGYTRSWLASDTTSLDPCLCLTACLAVSLSLLSRCQPRGVVMSLQCRNALPHSSAIVHG